MPRWIDRRKDRQHEGNAGDVDDISPDQQGRQFADVIDIGREEVDPEKPFDGGHDRFAHYVKKDKIVESAVTGKSVRALCGKKWIPSRDPEKYPICPACKEIFAGLKQAPEDS